MSPTIFDFVIAGLDPAIHPIRKKVGCADH
jgi:hypothetical protein